VEEVAGRKRRRLQEGRGERFKWQIFHGKPALRRLSLRCMNEKEG
jgi:hypothetical protein